jgi:glycosyltransferase involved in cell wall biosynthesis
MNISTITIVIPTFNRVELLAKALESLLKLNTGPQFTYEIVVIDNASTDGTPALLAQYKNEVRSFREERAGESFARNRGIQESNSDWLVFLDDDQTVDPDWLAQLWRTAVQRTVQIVACSVYLDLNPTELSRLGPAARNLLGESTASQAYQFGGNFLPACCGVLVHRTVFDRIGLFDEGLTVASDTNFFLRARQAGYAMWFEPKAVSYHYVPAFRMERSNLLSRALWQGAYFAILFGGGSRLSTGWIAMSRLLKSALLNLPGCLAADPKSRMDHQIKLWRAWGTVRGAVTVVFAGQSHGAFVDYLKSQARTRQAPSLQRSQAC